MTAKASHSARGHARKHTAAAKHVHGKGAKHHPKGTKASHHVTTQGKPQTVGRTIARYRGLALDGVACCTAEALAASLRLSGLSIGDGETLDLFRRAGGDPEAGAPILAVLEAASESGLAGVRLADFWRVDLGADPWQVIDDGLARSLILGLDLPGPHTVCDDGRAWWSWGEPYSVTDFPGVVLEEAWAVTWP